MNWVMIVGLAMTHLLAFVWGMVAMAQTKTRYHCSRVSPPPAPPPMPISERQDNG